MVRFYFFDCAPVAFFLEAATATSATTDTTVPAAETLLFMWGFNFFMRVVCAFFALAVTASGTAEHRATAATFVVFLFNWWSFFRLSFLKLQVEVEGI